jgi:zinc protease
MSLIVLRRIAVLTLAVAGVSVSQFGCASHGASVAPTTMADAVVPTVPKPAGYIDYTEETLPNGLHVIYAPMDNAPAIHVRVLYHVGSRDEDPQRQGFAHMFEHMMFRGSQHVKQEEHMKLISQVGGDSNAFTSYDQTTYVNTLPSSHLEMALWLEADRMSSFKVNDTIFQTERKVVSEEWRLRTANPPTGTLGQDFAKTAYTAHSYRWTPIGDMEQLKRATSADLQDFFNKYYIPNNATLIIAGDIDVAKTMWLVRKYYGWIPKGPEVKREVPAEPPQTEERKLVVYRRSVQTPTMVMGYKTTTYRDEDNVALDAVAQILGGAGGGGGGGRRGGGGGGTSRLAKLLTNPPAGQRPVALRATASNDQLEDLSTFEIETATYPGVNIDEVEAKIKAAVATFVASGPTADELAKYKLQARQRLLRSRETCTAVATALGEAHVFAGDTSLVNREADLIAELTPEKLKAVAAKYLQPTGLTIVQYLPDPTGAKAHKADVAAGVAPAATLPAKPNRPLVDREVPFPKGYRTTPPMGQPIAAHFNHGVVGEVNGVKVVTLSDHRVPFVNFSITMQGGGAAEPKAKIGLASLTAAMLGRGAGGQDYLSQAEELQSHGVSLGASDAGDTTRFTGSASVDQLDYAVDKAVTMLTQPNFAVADFNRLRIQSVQGLRQFRRQDQALASRELAKALWPDTPLSRESSEETLAAITLDDVKEWYKQAYRRDGAFIVVSGDITPERSLEIAAKLTAVIPTGKGPVATYDVPAEPAKRRIILIDNPDARQATILVGFRGYTSDAPERSAGSVASQVLSAGIDARLNRYLRAEKGWTYGAYGNFSAGRHSGEFVASMATNPDTAGVSVEGIFKVLGEMRAAEITDDELDRAKSRSIGAMVMSMQTVQQQAAQRTEILLNGWPDDYYEQVPARVSAVTKEDVLKVMQRYTDPSNAVVVVVGSADDVAPQLKGLGDVEIVPMPALPDGGGMGGFGGQ